jgi:hypothetical protein
MSMNLHALQLPPDEVAKIKRKPAEASAMTQAMALAAAGARYKGFKGLDYKFMLEAMGLRDTPRNRKQWGQYWGPMERQINRLKKAGEKASRKVGHGRMLDLDKSWQVLHYLFTGEAHAGFPPANTLLGGRELGEDLGYGPARLHEPAATAAFAYFLQPLTVEELQRRIDLRRMSALGIYCCDGGDAGSAEEVEGDVEYYFPRLQRFVAKAAKDGHGMLLWLS